MTTAIVIAGRPNVGKSTLFNRLAGRRLALVDDMPGLTRDRKEAEATIGGERTVRIIDTAGLEDAVEGSIAARMSEQSRRAILSGDVVLFMIDARAGITPADELFAEHVRASGKPVILVANKCEGRASNAGYYEAYKLGLGEPVAISAEHGEGIGELYARIGAALDALGKPEAGEEGEAEVAARDRPLKLAIVGRPNAGKSTLVNTLLGEERMITGPEPGLTRDAISTDFAWRDRKVTLYDTAGLRRKSRISARAEKLAVGDALNAIRFAEVVVLLIEVDRALDKQDLQIAALAEREGRALVIAINKWDLVEERDKTLRTLRQAVADQLPQVKGVPVIPVSALSGRGTDKLMKAVFDVYEAWNKRVTTAALNRWFSEAIESHAPPAVAGRRIKLRYITQSNARPPTFIMFCSHPEAVAESYKRYLVNSLREAFDLTAVPIRLHLRKPKNPYAKDGS